MALSLGNSRRNRRLSRLEQAQGRKGHGTLIRLALHVISAITGPLTSSVIFAHFAITGNEVVAFIGLIGVFVSSGASVYVTLLNHRKITRIEHKTDDMQASTNAVRETSRESMEALRDNK